MPSPYYDQYYGSAEISVPPLVQSQENVKSEVLGESYDPISDYYARYYGIDGASAVSTGANEVDVAGTDFTDPSIYYNGDF